MAAKLLAALNRITLEDAISVRLTCDKGRKTSSTANHKGHDASSTHDNDGETSCDPPGRESPLDESRYCKLCGLKFNSEEQLGQHLKGKRHEKSLRRINLSAVDESKMAGYEYDPNDALQAMGDNASDPVTKALIGNITGTLPRKRVLDTIRCDICSIDFNEKGQYQMHIEGKRHAKRQKLHDLVVTPPSAVQTEISGEADAVGEDGEPKILSADGLNCFVCCVSVNSEQMMATHLSGAKHKTKLSRVTKADIVRSAKAVADKKAAAAETAATVLSKGGATAMAAAAAAVHGTTQKKIVEGSSGAVDLHCESCGVHANSAQQWDQHIQSKKHKDKINPPPPHPNKPKPGGLAKPRINFIKATSDDNGFNPSDQSGATGWNGGGRGRGGPGVRGGRGAPMSGRGGGPPRGRGQGWNPGGRGRGRGGGGVGGPRGGGYGGGRGGGGSYDGSGGNYGNDGGGKYGADGYQSYGQEQYDGYSSNAVSGSASYESSYASYPSASGGEGTAATSSASTNSFGSGGGYASGGYTENYGAGNANSSYGSNYGDGSSSYGGAGANTGSASTSTQPASGYKVTPAIGSTFVKGKTLQSNYY